MLTVARVGLMGFKGFHRIHLGLPTVPTLICETWERYERDRKRIQESVDAGISGFLFRGQERADWRLETTLERTVGDDPLVHEYYKSARRIKPRLETFTDRLWDFPNNLALTEYDPFSVELSQGKLPAYPYLIYLRHHGFPSPLLDWTRSPHIAAFFAFRRQTKGNVAIYMYAEAPEDMKTRSSNSPTIHSFGPNVTSHRRHFLQQSEYTVCVQYLDDLWRFAKHEAVFSDNNQYQDLLWKFVIPATERQVVLKQLDGYNLNAFSLFGTEEALLETLAVRELEGQR